MITFQYIEDYLEVLAGYRKITANGKSPGPIDIFGGSNVISLARYDVSILNSMANFTMNGGALTDRQSELAVRVVDKYKKQFSSKGVDVAPSVQNPQFRVPIRVIDRTKAIYIKDDRLVIRFPYDKTLVPAITAAAKESKGSLTFDREAKIWYAALTEFNVNWAVCFGQEHGFNIDPEVMHYMELILAAEKTPYRIELVAVNGDVTITNAAHSLYDYIDKELGGLGVHNFVKLIDYAPVLGYTVHPDIAHVIKDEYDPIVNGIITNRESHVLRPDPTSTGDDILKSVVEYSNLTERWPVYIYEPDASNKLRNSAKSMFAPEEFLDTVNKKSSDEVDLTGVKCVYFNKVKRSWQHRIPILVSTNAMLYGSDKQNMLQLAEKVVYYTATTYNKEAPTIAGNISN